MPAPIAASLKFDYADINAAIRRQNESSRRIARASLVFLAAGAAVLAVAILFRSYVPSADVVIPVLALFLFVPVLIAFMGWTESGVHAGRRWPRAITLTDDGWRMSFEEGADTAFRWKDGTLLFRVVDRARHRFPFPEAQRYMILVSRADAPETQTVLGEVLPLSAYEPLLARATAHGLHVYPERIRKKVGKMVIEQDEIQLREGPAIDTEVRGLLQWRRRTEPSPR